MKETVTIYLSGSAERHHVKEGEDPEEELLGQHLVDGGRVVRVVGKHLGQFPPDIVVAGADRVTGVRVGGALGVARVARVTRVPPMSAVSPSSSSSSSTIGHAIRSE